MIQIREQPLARISVRTLIVIGLISFCVLSLMQQSYSTLRKLPVEKGNQPTDGRLKVSSTSAKNLQQQRRNQVPVKPFYNPTESERYVLENAVSLNLHETDWAKLKPTCDFWKESNEKFFPKLQQYREELKDYKNRLLSFSAIPDLRLALRDITDDASQEELCRQVELDEKGLSAIFPSGLLSEGSFGKIEPLLPPLRHPEICADLVTSIMDLTYIVHDFGAICRRLTPYTRTIFIDMGASLTFHQGELQPALFISELYRKFGFPFDHIYAFELKFTEPSKVFEILPEQLLPAFHWINVGVNSDPESRFNPLKMLLNSFREEDLVVVKLDIDTSSIEVPLFKQILEDPRFDKLVDQIYFEHHVLLGDLAPAWGGTMSGTVEESLKLFGGVRAKGIAAHTWV